VMAPGEPSNTLHPLGPPMAPFAAPEPPPDLRRLAGDIGRLVKQAFAMFPMLNAYALQIGLAVLAVAALLYSAVAMLLGVRDALSHKSGLYQFALLRNYRGENLFNLAPGTSDQRKLAEASFVASLEKFRKSS
jgi:hypothetical protein